MKTDISVLHKTHDFLCRCQGGRRVGRTFYQCHSVVGQLQILENSTILVIVQNHNGIEEFMKTLVPILEEYNIKISKENRSSWRVWFEDNTNCLKFTTVNYIKEGIPLISYGCRPDQYPIWDLHQPVDPTIENLTSIELTPSSPYLQFTNY